MTGSGFELGTDGPTTILVGIDGSRTSMRAAAYAAGLARRQSAELIAVHVITPSGLAGLAPSAAGSFQQTQRQVADELRTELVGAAASIGLDLEFVSAVGDAYDQLSLLATQRRVDAVVVGASEKTGHRIVGSLATRLVRAARWPVTVVP